MFKSSRFANFCLLSALSLILAPACFGRVLNVTQVAQEQDQWCWAGSSRAVLLYYGTDLAQCTIAEYARTRATWHDFGSVNCCTDPTQGCNYWNYNWGADGSIQDILQHWGVNNHGVSAALSSGEANTQLDTLKPFVIRWGWASGGGHFIVGHGLEGNTFYYMDPWPGEGSKQAAYDWVVSDGNHTWTHTNVMDTAPATASIQVTAPNGGESWTLGSQQNITWTAQNLTGNVTVALYRLGTWQSDLGTAAASAGTFAWTISAGLTAAADYKVRVYQGSVEDYSDNIFTLSSGGGTPGITVTAPNGGENWALNSSQNITWTATGLTGYVDIELYKGGAYLYWLGWESATAGTYAWTIPDYYDPGADYKIRIYQTPVEDYSNNNFTISSGSGTPSLTVTAPNGGENWQLGSQHNITWPAQNITGNVAIHWVRDGALTTGIAEVPVSPGSYTWTIPTDLTPGSAYKIMIRNGTTEDSSDSNFTLSSASAPAITVTTPNGGESWQRGTPHNVTWTATDLTGTVTIDLYKGGAFNQNIGTAAAIAGTYAWTIPAGCFAGTDYKVRIHQGAVEDYSNAAFAITAGTGNYTIGGYLGIGTENPARAVHIVGSNAVFRMDRNQDSAAFMLVRTDGSGAPQKTFVVGVNSSGSNQGEFVINDLGAAVSGGGSRRLTIGTSGDAAFTGTVSATSFPSASSARLKEAVCALENPLELLAQLRGVSFLWHGSGLPSLGLIAEEVRRALPEAVLADAAGAALGVDYNQLAALLVASLNDQQAEIAGLQEQLRDLRILLEQLRAIRQSGAASTRPTEPAN